MSAMPAARAPKRRVLAVVLGFALTASLTVVPAGPAHAASSTTCTGTSHAEFSPGLTFTPQTVTFTETNVYTTCVSTDPTLTSGSLGTLIYPVPGATCNLLAIAPAPSSIPLYWNNGQTSTATVTYAATVTAGVYQLTSTGTITAGEFTGATIVSILIRPLVNPLLCLTPGGVPSQDGTMTAQIIGL